MSIKGDVDFTYLINLSRSKYLFRMFHKLKDSDLHPRNKIWREPVFFPYPETPQRTISGFKSRSNSIQSSVQCWKWRRNISLLLVFLGIIIIFNIFYSKYIFYHLQHHLFCRRRAKGKVTNKVRVSFKVRVTVKESNWSNSKKCKSTYNGWVKYLRVLDVGENYYS